MKRIFKWIAIIIAILIVLVLVLPFVIDVNTFRPRIESELTSALGRKVTVGNMSLSLWSGSLAADNIAIADDPSFGSPPFVRADAFKVGVNVFPLIFSRTLEIRNITLNHPQVALLRTPSGKWNFSTLGNSPGSSAPKRSDPGNSSGKESTSEQSLAENLSVGELSIKGGQISVADTNAASKARVYKNVDATVKDFSFTTKFPFTLTADLPGGGNAKLNGTGGPINRADTSQTPLNAKITVKDLDLAKSGFIDPASGFAGSVDFDGTVQSDGHDARSNGTATADKLKLSPKGSAAPRAVNLRYATTYDMQKETGVLNQGDVSVGKAVAKLGGTFNLRGDSAVLNMKLNADSMPVDDLETLLPALGVQLPKGSSLQGGTLSSDLTITGPVDRLVIAGPVKLANTKLAGFDMGSKLSAISALSGTKTGSDTSIQNFSSDVHYSPSGIETQNINLVLPAIGTVTGSGTVSPENALDYKMTASLSGSMVSGLSQMAGMSGKGTSVPFFIRGTASDPKFVPDVKGMLGNQLGQRLGSQVPGGQNAQGVMNSLGGLFGKKKKQ